MAKINNDNAHSAREMEKINDGPAKEMPNRYARLNDIELARAIESWMDSSYNSLTRDAINDLALEAEKRGMIPQMVVIKNRKE